MENILEEVFTIPSQIEPIYIYGNKDSNIAVIENNLNVRLVGRGHQIRIYGKPYDVNSVKIVLEDIIAAAKKSKYMNISDLETSINIARHETEKTIPGFQTVRPVNNAITTIKNTIIRAKTDGQQLLLDEIDKNDIVFSIGPAGTGKTYLAVAKAVQYLKESRVKKLILARPAVEAGESLGYLHGDFREKIDPYLKPLYDALEDMMPVDLLKKYIDQGIIEILPLAYMRGRTLNNAFVILDEAQNTTFTQMKMFLTRLGINSKAVITGDITQIDLPTSKDSGLIASVRILENITGISFVRMKKDDVVRHQLVKDIIDAYDRYGNEKKGDINSSVLDNSGKNE
ncbi:MAG: PhoH family protein [Calditrichaceae bacterium]|nr:PhoH family protein [Calditrichaceae bacterium]RQV95627.1 MAG: PhoH family protein [Calditrichota bacterium]